MNVFKGSGEIASDIVNTGKFVSFSLKAGYKGDDGGPYYTYVRINMYGEEVARSAGPYRKGDLASVEGPLKWDKGGDGYDGKLVCNPVRVAFKQGDPAPEPRQEPRTQAQRGPERQGYVPQEDMFNQPLDDELPF